MLLKYFQQMITAKIWIFNLFWSHCAISKNTARWRAVLYFQKNNLRVKFDFLTEEFSFSSAKHSMSIYVISRIHGPWVWQQDHQLFLFSFLLHAQEGLQHWQFLLLVQCLFLNHWVTSCQFSSSWLSVYVRKTITSLIE